MTFGCRYAIISFIISYHERERMKLSDIVDISSGVLLSRLKESTNLNHKYFVYDQADLQADLAGEYSKKDDCLYTEQKVLTLKNGDIIFSLISGVATVVCDFRSGYIYSHNYAILTPIADVDVKFLVYLLNCDADLRRGLLSSTQGSMSMKYSINQLKNLDLKPLPQMQIQQKIGRVYFMLKRLEMLKKRVCEQESILTTKLLSKIAKANNAKQ